MFLKSSLAASFLFSLAFAAVFCSRADGRDCGLSISVLGEADSVVPYRIQSFKSTAGQDVTTRFRGLRAEMLPCGTYTYELSRSDVGSTAGQMSGVVVVEDMHQRLTLKADRTLMISPQGVFAIDRTRSTSYVLRGVLKNLPAGTGPTWIRFITIAANSAREVEVNDDGTFELYSPLPDAYAVLVFQPGRLLAAQYLVLSPQLKPDSIEIHLPAVQ